MTWEEEVLAHHKKQVDNLLQSRWAVAFRDRGLGHGDFGIVIDGSNDVVMECPNREVAEHVVAVHNQAIVS